MATTAERERVAYHILAEVSGGNLDMAYDVCGYYANVMHLDERDHIIARGMARTWEDAHNNGYQECLDDSGCQYLA